jgi:hypothetical protein
MINTKLVGVLDVEVPKQALTRTFAGIIYSGRWVSRYQCPLVRDRQITWEADALYRQYLR